MKRVMFVRLRYFNICHQPQCRTPDRVRLQLFSSIETQVDNEEISMADKLEESEMVVPDIAQGQSGVTWPDKAESVVKTMNNQTYLNKKSATKRAETPRAGLGADLVI
jgi:hypothetical protein